MYQVVVLWNLLNEKGKMVDESTEINIRGYDVGKIQITGEFANRLAEEEIKPLSVSNISDVYCPTRRDLYYYKGIKKPKLTIPGKRWGSSAGYLIEKYIEGLLDVNDFDNCKKYDHLQEKALSFHEEFISEGRKSIIKLNELEENDRRIEKGDTEWLTKLLSSNGRAELAMRLLHSIIKDSDSLDIEKMKLKEEINPNTLQIGISSESPAKPDFIFPSLGIVGDIKTGIQFKSHFQLTCAGYALAYENEHGTNNNVDWGIIYFFPSKMPEAFERPLSFAQIFIFPITDYLRESFLERRDEAYKIISQDDPPNFPLDDEREHCKYSCKFQSYCLSQGLDIKNEEK